MREAAGVSVESTVLDGAPWVLIRVLGTRTMRAAEELEAALERHVFAPRCRVLVRFDFATLIDSMTIGILVVSGVRARAAGGQVRLQLPADLRRRYGMWFGFAPDDDWNEGIPGPRLRPSGPLGGSESARP